MPAGGMTARENPIGATAVIGDVGVRPGKGAGDVFDVGWVLDFRRQAVIDDDGSDAHPSKCPAELFVFIFVTALPSTPVDEEQDRIGFCLFGNIEIEALECRIGV